MKKLLILFIAFLLFSSNVNGMITSGIGQSEFTTATVEEFNGNYVVVTSYDFGNGMQLSSSDTHHVNYTGNYGLGAEPRVNGGVDGTGTGFFGTVIPSTFRFNFTSGSEMSHLFYDELGGTANEPIITSGDPDLGLFPQLQMLFAYWTGTENVDDTDLAWVFKPNNGSLTFGSKEDLVFVIAVHNGDVAAAVPYDLPDTGQTGDYTATFGEDSDYTINPPSYTDNGGWNYNGQCNWLLCGNKTDDNE